MLGHQHGALDELWALRFWPDLPARVSELVSLATPYRGTALAVVACERSGSCPPSAWQIRQGSEFLAALTRKPVPRGPSYTSITTRFDELIIPQPAASRLPGASNIVLQDICPGRPVEHFTVLSDNLAYRLVLDALAHPGPADPRRIDRAVCSGPLTMPGTTTPANALRTLRAAVSLDPPACLGR